MTGEVDPGELRAFTVAAFRHLQPNSIFYRTGLSRQELLEALYNVLPEADVISIRRVRADTASEKQLRLMDEIHRELNVPLPNEYPNITKAQASSWISEKLPFYREARRKEGEPGNGGARA